MSESPSLAGLTVEDSPSFLRKKSSSKLLTAEELPTSADLDTLLRKHHKSILDGTIDLASVPVVMARVFEFLVEEARSHASRTMDEDQAVDGVQKKEVRPSKAGA